MCTRRYVGLCIIYNLYSVMLSRRGQAGLEAEILSLASDSASKNVLGLENLSSACPRTFYFGLVKMSVMMELVITVSLQ